MSSPRTEDDSPVPGAEPAFVDGRVALGHQPKRSRARDRADAPTSLVIAAAWCWRILIVAATGLGLILLGARFYLPVLPIVFALLLTALLHPLLVGMRRLRLPRAMATWLTIVIALLVLGGVGWFVWTRAASSYSQLIAQVDGIASQLRGYLGQVTGSNTLQLAQLQQRAVSWLQQNSDTVIGGVLSFGTVLGELVTGLIVTIFLTFYFLQEGDRIWSWVVRLSPSNVQPSVRGAGYRSWHALSGWVVGTALIALFHGVVVGFTLYFLSVPLAVALAVLVFIGSFIPIIGSFVFGGLAVLVTLVSQGLGAAVVVLVILLIDSQIEAHLLQPFVVGKAVQLHPVAIVLALTAGGIGGGIVGAIITVPIVAALHAAVKYLTGVEDLHGKPCRVDADRMAPEPPPEYAPLPLYASSLSRVAVHDRDGSAQCGVDSELPVASEHVAPVAHDAEPPKESEQTMDITEIIQHQHDEQRRMFAYLEQWPRDDHEGLGAVWERLAILLETHAEAEENYFYPELLRLGTGGADAESVTEEVEDAVKDHNEIRQAVRAAYDHELGSDGWWTAVVDANVHNSDHMGEEERQDLADFRQQASLELRHEIALKFIRYQSQKAATGIEPVDKNPQQYVAERADDMETDSEERAAKLAAAATDGRPTTGAGPTKTTSKEAAKG